MQISVPKQMIYIIMTILLISSVLGFSNKISYSGIAIANTSNSVLYNGTFNVTSKIFSSSTATSPLFSTAQNITIVDGNYVVSFDYNVSDTNATFYIESQIQEDNQTRFLYTASAQSIRANQSNDALLLNGQIASEFSIAGHVTGTLAEANITSLVLNAITYNGLLGFNNLTKCNAGEILEMAGGVWTCGTDSTGTDTNTNVTVTSIQVTGTTTKTLTLEQSDGGLTNLTTTWTDISGSAGGNSTEEIRAAINNSGNYLFTSLQSDDWTNVTITESQISDLTDITDTTDLWTLNTTDLNNQSDLLGLNYTTLNNNFVGQNEYPNLDTDSTNDFDGLYASLSGRPDFLSNFTDNVGFYFTEANLTNLLDDNYLSVSASTGNSTIEIQTAINNSGVYNLQGLNSSFIQVNDTHVCLSDGTNCQVSSGGNSTEQIITAINGTALNGTNFLSIKCDNIVFDSGVGSAGICDGDDAAGAGSYDLNVTTDSGTEAITDSETLDITGAGVISTSMSGNVVTITDNSEYFEVITSNGNNADADSASDSLTLKNDSAITISIDSSTDTIEFNLTDTSSVSDSDNSGNTFIQDLTFDAWGRVLTLATGTATSGGNSTEEIQDAAGAMDGGTETLISVTYDDAGNQINYVVDNDLANYDNSNSLFITNHTRNKTAEALTCVDCLSGTQIAELTDADISNTLTCSILTDDNTYALVAGETFTGDVDFQSLVNSSRITVNDTDVCLSDGTNCEVHTTNTDSNASTICSGTTTYLDGEGNCDDISSVYVTVGTKLGNSTTEIQAVAVGGEVTGTVGSITLNHDALDDQYYDSEADLTGLLDDNYVSIGTKLGNSTQEIRDAVNGTDLIYDFTSNKTLFWDDLDSPADINTGDLFNDDTYATTASEETFDENIVFAKNITVELINFEVDPTNHRILDNTTCIIIKGDTSTLNIC